MIDAITIALCYHMHFGIQTPFPFGSCDPGSSQETKPGTA